MQPSSPDKKPRLFARIKAWVHANPKRTYILVGLGIIIAANLIVLAVFWQQPKEVESPKKVQPAKQQAPKPVYYSPLTGEQIESEAAKTKPVTAIMLENSPDARPQSGLKDAEVVYEAVAEGGITRFLAVYQQKKPQLIGPVRSLRMYYLDWATPYDASIAHVGGSLNALNTVRNGSYRDIDQFFNSTTYWRATDRYAPHNVYTNFEKLDQLNTAKGYNSSSPVGLERVDIEAPVKDKKKTSEAAAPEVIAPEVVANSVNLTISGPLYNSSYTYDPATKLYARSQAGAPHLDREAGQITAKTVVALRVNMVNVLEDGYRENITTSGTGEAIIFQDGKATKATWNKSDQKGQLVFTDATGGQVKLARGTTWISAIPTDGGDVTWQ
ncbi:DUF3048 domain-containing protein [Candidatus Saccharibacteria bacterium]|nr:DUF3048 domain-containing protein [Candidatus Saccharibacteria bacterium]